MKFIGYSKIFSLKNNEQYNTIGEYWDYFSSIYGLENLRGLGLNWKNGTMEYIIGIKEGVISNNINLEGSTFKEVDLPDDGWIIVDGMTDDLEKMYEEIYKVSTLLYEIETFNLDGSCRLLIIRNI